MDNVWKHGARSQQMETYARRSEMEGPPVFLI